MSDQQVTADPRFGLVDLAAVEVSNRGGGKWFAENRHTVFPRLLANQSEAFDMPEVFQIELDILPEGAVRTRRVVYHPSADGDENAVRMVSRRSQATIGRMREITGERKGTREDQVYAFA
jgi:hypothetical protein